ncbi:snoRna binding domain-containing protein [Cardiosporidium cionae]|uniref:SnoRna binding domain-containing protein n=1 Tax=Cardiosporidium cionae TaxID=476202 RepID=A0ABQ7J631_9APIC|nr:snoRna binding domain-containing protein [Cardiosporidium cionae]|eukprot:KAF8819461.1 snoRna binding domain-containing protein [Cardiosporidium cionae]
MATLADSFLQDLEELNVEEEEEETGELIEDDDFIIDAIEEYEQMQSNVLCVVSDLSRQQTFIDILERVRKLKDIPVEQIDTSESTDDEYELIDQCNKFVINSDTEILNIHKFIRDIFSKRFPELESIVYSPLEFIAVVQRIQNETDLTHIDLSDLLPNTIIMAVTVAASMTTGSPLPPTELEKALGAAKEAMHLAECRKEILLYLESRMNLLAPNLTSLLGSALAARLVTHAGGLLSLARMPAQNIMSAFYIQLIGSSKKLSLGFGTSQMKGSMGLICASEIVQNTPPAFRNRAVRLISTKCSLAARVDSFNQNRNGEVGIAHREHIISMLIKLQEPPPAPQKKSLPIPDEKQKTRRGGKRLRRMKEKYGITEVRKQANRLKFGLEAEDEPTLEIGKGLGMLGKSTGLGKVRLQVKTKKLHVAPKRRALPQSSNHPASGMTSSLVFTPVQGIELCNPDAARLKSHKTGDTYFSNTRKFVKSMKTS